MNKKNWETVKFKKVWSLFYPKKKFSNTFKLIIIVIIKSILLIQFIRMREIQVYISSTRNLKSIFCKSKKILINLRKTFI